MLEKFSQFKTGKDLYEKPVKDLLDQFLTIINKEHTEKEREEEGLFEKDILEYFNDVQDEFDSDEEPSIYSVSFYKSLSGLYRAYGPCHALLKYMIEHDDFYPIINDDCADIQYLSEEDVNSKIEKLEIQLNMYKNIK